VSCNIAFGELVLELSADMLAEYTDAYGFTQRFDIDGITSARGAFHRAGDETADLAWSGIGQHRNMVCPAAMLRFVGAVANDGIAVDMRLRGRGFIAGALPGGSQRIISRDTAARLSAMMNYSIHQSASVNDSFPGLKIHAKTGTAQVGGDLSPHAWFAGYITNEGYPLAFVVIIENGGGGFANASPIANRVLQAAIAN
jgi:peptidoglycan glycosyltransferase